LITTAAYVSCIAQNGSVPQLSIGLDAGLPTGTVSQVYGSVIGASTQLELHTNNSNLKFMLTAGYSDFRIKSEYTSIFESASYGQLEAGARYYFIPMIYIEGDFGASFNFNKNYTEQKVGLAYDPVLGVNLPLSSRSAIDAGVHYDGRVESGGTISQVALRVAYKFNL
jgi:hypothetical protein